MPRLRPLRPWIAVVVPLQALVALLFLVAAYAAYQDDPSEAVGPALIGAASALNALAFLRMNPRLVERAEEERRSIARWGRAER